MKQMADAVRDWDFHVCKDSSAPRLSLLASRIRKLHPEAFGENDAFVRHSQSEEAEQLDAANAPCERPPIT